MKNQHNKRWKLFANFRIQGGLLLRLAIYWILFQFVQVGTFAALDFLSDGSQDSRSFLFQAACVSCLMLPIVMLDMLVFSNRFAGPIHRIEKNLDQLANHQPGDPVNLRPSDFYTGLSHSYNKLRDRLHVSSVGDGDSVAEDQESWNQTTSPELEESHV